MVLIVALYGQPLIGEFITCMIGDENFTFVTDEEGKALISIPLGAFQGKISIVLFYAGEGIYANSEEIDIDITVADFDSYAEICRGDNRSAGRACGRPVEVHDNSYFRVCGRQGMEGHVRILRLFDCT